MNGNSKEVSAVIKWPLENYQYELKFSLERIGMYLHNVYENGIKLEVPDKLYKFYGVDDHNLETLRASYLYFSSPRDFNDPFDCLTNRERHIVRGGKEIKKHRDNLGVCCFSTSNENPLMWGHYTNQYKGFCIKYNNENLLKDNHIQIKTFVSYLKDYKPTNAEFSKVYSEIEKNNNLTEEVKLLILHGITHTKSYAWKYYDWKYEQEFRAISWTTDQFNRKLSIETKEVEEIYIGHRMKDKEPYYYKNLISIIKEKYPQCKIYEVEPHPLVVKLKFNRLN